MSTVIIVLMVSCNIISYSQASKKRSNASSSTGLAPAQTGVPQTATPASQAALSGPQSGGSTVPGTVSLISDRTAVEELIQTYFDGWATGDTTKLGRAMHATCHLKFFREGTFTMMDRAKYLGLQKLHSRNKDLITQVVALDITGNTGSAKAEIITVNDKFTDYFNLMKDGSLW